ncbi:hypothetical protein LCGC14_0389670 [marine sediment metagenome]|uniref:Methyltransferase type 11 domain-containing protein n=1 Tax=marine sediment metagenome TaxID=412755 RepID=A0A0F9T019_9ZZZZ
MNKKLTQIEIDRYDAIWKVPAYSEVSPGEGLAAMFGKIAKPKTRETLIDLGCGRGAGGLNLMGMYGLAITYLDVVKVAGVPEPYICQSLWEPIKVTRPGRKKWKWDYGYCCDVMEHLPKEFTMLAVKNMLAVCEKVFFCIAFLPDRSGPKHTDIGFAVGAGQLHHTIENFVWWRDRLEEICTLIDGRDLMGRGVFYVES